MVKRVEKSESVAPAEVEEDTAAVEDTAESPSDSELDEDKEFMRGYADITSDSLIMNGYVSHVVEVNDSISYKIRTLRKREELDVKKRIGEYDGANMYVFDETNVNTAAYCLMEINGEPLPEEFVDKREAVVDLPDTLVVDILDEFRDLNKALIIMLKGSSKNSLARRLVGPEQI